MTCAYFVGGINGAGKSTFVKKVAANNPGFVAWHGSSEFMRWLNLKPGDYDALRVMDDEYKIKEFGKLVEWTLDHFTGNTILIDSHFVRSVAEETYSVTGDWMHRMSGLVHLTALPTTVLERIHMDTKKRDSVPEGASEIHTRHILSKQIISSDQEVLACARRYNIPYCRISNSNIDFAMCKFFAFDTQIKEASASYLYAGY